MIPKRLHTEKTCILLPGLLNRDECAQLIETYTEAGFSPASTHYPNYYRNNQRLVMELPALADTFLERIKSFIPDEIIHGSKEQNTVLIWRIQGINPRFRACKYGAGEYFHRHLDGVQHASEREQTKLTFMVYLNGSENFEGGRTLFYAEKDDVEPCETYTPQTGDAIIFDHGIWHEGEEVRAGEKFVLRSDIFYQRDEPNYPITPFQGHLGYIWSLEKLGENIVSGGRDKMIHLWNGDGSLLQTLQGHNHSILCLLKLDENHFASGSRDQSVKIWKRGAEGKYYLHSAMNLGGGNVLSLVKWDSKSFIAGCADGTLKRIDWQQSTVKSMHCHSGWVWGIARINETHFATVSEDQTLKIWREGIAEPVKVYPDSTSLMCILYCEAKNLLVTGNLKGEITLRWLNDQWEVIRTQTNQAHKGLVKCLAFQEPNLLASGGEDNSLKIWDVDTGNGQATYMHDDFVQAILPAENGSWISASYDGTIQQWPLFPNANHSTVST